MWLYHIDLNDHIYAPGISAYMCPYMWKSACIYVCWKHNHISAYMHYALQPSPGHCMHTSHVCYFSANACCRWVTTIYSKYEKLRNIAVSCDFSNFESPSMPLRLLSICSRSKTLRGSLASSLPIELLQKLPKIASSLPLPIEELCLLMTRPG